AGSGGAADGAAGSGGGGAGAGGHSGTGGNAGSAGNAGTGGAGGMPNDAATTDRMGPDVVCWNDAGTGLVGNARSCTNDSDCKIVPDPTCCGADMAYGVAKAQAATYASCFGLPPGACQGLGCAKFVGYRTDTGEMTRFEGSGMNALSQV